jgi:hypothetical protein
LLASSGAASAVFVQFAEQALTVNRVQRPAVETVEGQTEPVEVLVLRVNHPTDHLPWVKATQVSEHFGDSAQRTGPGWVKSFSLKVMCSL